ncbi:MAG: 2Fe-2S iron-sulfur cluster binding domain-containing protein [Cyclobacteriaceae bacterium]|nr:2Fe-2S iron-sulfur cluster binding domain-containing protein [Cyclobacteriaceae bacterium]UYN85915.1 MAG: 2Fe-2S iron-sulfur cluster binding domain-containing protein [Cyclobacteriaceae bacterium]
MPIIRYQGEILECKPGATLRDTILKYGLTVHNRNARYINCRGIGTCGTCAVKITGNINPLTRKEKWRLNFPPHKLTNGLRLACQVKVMDDIEVQKFDGFWGEESF